MRVLRVGRPCLRCGHPAGAHRLETGESVLPTADGIITRSVYLGPCEWESPDGPTVWCACRGYVPDGLSRVSELLGLDVRRVVEAL